MDVGTAVDIALGLISEIKKIVDANLALKDKILDVLETLDLLGHVIKERGKVFAESPIQQKVCEIFFLTIRQDDRAYWLDKEKDRGY